LTISAVIVRRQVQPFIVFTGLADDYIRERRAHQLIRMLMALPLLPAAHMSAAFDELSRLAHSRQTKRLCAYVKATWLSSTVWKPTSLSVFDQQVRTNNDCEGWHRRLNGLARRADVPLYSLIVLLHQEASLLPLQIQLASDGKVLRRYSRRYAAINDRLQQLWTSYKSGDLTTSRFLRAAARLQLASVDL